MNPRLRLALALLLPFVAAGIQWLLWDDYIKPYVWFLFFPAAFFSAWLAGLKGGLASGVIGALLVWYVYIPPQFSFELKDAAASASIALFVIMGGLFGWVFERLGKMQKRALAASEARFEATFEQAAVGIALVAPDGRWLRVNRKLCAIVGYPPEELLTKTFQDITYPEDLNADLEFVRRMLAQEIDTYAMEKRYFRKDGSLVWINLTVALVRRPEGAPDYFISVIEDISARKVAQEALRESEERFRELFESMGDGVAIYEVADEGRDFVFIGHNKAGERITGVPRANALGRRVRDIFPGVESMGLLQVLRRVWSSGRPEHFPVTQYADERLSLWVDNYVFRLPNGKVVSVYQDLTDQRRSEQMLRERNEELESFDRASVGRELEMIRLKRQVNALAAELGRPAPHDLSFAEAPPQEETW